MLNRTVRWLILAAVSAAPAIAGAQTIDDLVDFVAGRALAQLGLDTTLVKPWGDQ